jgi:phasin family protein
MAKKPVPAEDAYAAASKYFNEMQDISARSWKNLIELQLQFGKLWLEFLEMQTKRLAGVTNPSDFAAAEAGIATEYSGKFYNNIRQAIELMTNTQKELMECAEKCGFNTSMFAFPAWPVKKESPSQQPGKRE